MFPDEWDEFQEWARPAAKPTWRNRIVEGFISLLGIFELFLVLVAAATYPIHLFMRHLLAPPAEFLDWAERWLDGKIERVEDEAAYRRRMGLTEVLNVRGGDGRPF